MATGKNRYDARPVIGWDIGGAHTKIARLDGRGRVLDVAQYPCALWRGLDRLDTLLVQLDADLDFRQHRHALTMTGELADIFRDRRDGVRKLLRCFGKRVAPSAVRVYALDGRLRSVTWALENPDRVASANWHATATWVGRRLENAVLLDVGSTTTDLIPIRGGKAAVQGNTDAQRLQSGELLYSGVIRTPVMAVVDSVAFAGARQRIAAEHFATMADIYHLVGDLPVREDQDDTADGRGKRATDCARRLARMLGRDLRDAELEVWRRLAASIARAHQDRLRMGLEEVVSRFPATKAVPVVGAGVGRFLARRLARQLKFPYMNVSDLFSAPPGLRAPLCVAAPASAVAALALGAATATRSNRTRTRC
jgi:probable H4MPT-linked C1 transfer pathway protein